MGVTHLSTKTSRGTPSPKTKKTFYITTPIYYPSDKLHIGHAYTTVAADAIARYKRFKGFDVRFLTGTDEHGQKIERRAKEAGKTPQQFVDEIVAGIKDLWSLLRISYDDFIRTTERRHIEVVQDVFEKILKKGDIYKSEYEGWYCVPCETFWLERQLEDGKCPNPDCRRPVELVREESYFFKLSKYQDKLIRYIEENPDFIKPASRRNEMLNFCKSGLEDLCVSRTTFNWGIPVPGDPKHVVYVWFDALTNYISALGYGRDGEEFRKYWPADLHLVGKEIMRFHTIIWPIILMALDLPLPKQVFGHGWLVLEGGKMSKSKGNVIDPVVLVDKYGVDAVRYFLLREVPFGSDGYYSEEALKGRINSDLANDLGNLLHRSLGLVERYWDGRVPTPQAGDTSMADYAREVVKKYEEAMDGFLLSDALTTVFSLVTRCNKYLDEEAPWAKMPRGEEAAASTVLYNVLESVRIVAGLLVPFLVETPEAIWTQLGIDESPRGKRWEEVVAWGGLKPSTRTRKAGPLFPRIEIRTQDAHPSTEGGAGEAGSELIDIERFKELDLRVAKVTAAEAVSGSKKLLKLQLDVGDGIGQRQVVAGIAKHYKPEDLVGKYVVLVANLKPAVLKGIRSEGMILAASHGEDCLRLLTVDGEIPPGSGIS
ncbi:MAG TPA: methionine--tRNA ligase [Clostridia bacterium]|nr:methionine--tRNA ligase [Clostridia bacterium]